MSEQFGDDDLYDKYEAQPGNSDLAPVVSWKKSEPGDGFKGVLLPARPVERPDKGYEVRREYKQENKKEGIPAGFTVWPPKNNPEGINRPVVEAEFTIRWPNEDLSKARKVPQDHFTFETGLTDGSLISKPQRERWAEMDPPKDAAAETRRRVIEQGKDLTDKIAAALKPVGGKPLPGQTWYIGIASTVPNEHGGESYVFKVEITPPTPETLKVVADYVAKAKQAAAEALDAADPGDKYAKPVALAPGLEMASGVAVGPSEPPPF